MKITLYVEGGGKSDELRTMCREGFAALLARSGLAGRMPRIVACGSRNEAYDRFTTAIRKATPDDFPILLVDSEDPMGQVETLPASKAAWEHLRSRDGWSRPRGAANDQAQLMVTCMETWIMADHAALVAFFGASLRRNALLPVNGLEGRPRDAVQDALAQATRDCGRDRAYRKGRRSFRVLATLDPNTLKRHLPHFARLITTLHRHP